MSLSEPKNTLCAINRFYPARRVIGELAQLGERLLCTLKSKLLCFLGFFVVSLSEPKNTLCAINRFYPARRVIGELAQLGERLLCTQEVSGSIPLFSTIISLT